MYVCLVPCSPNHPLVAVRDLEPHIIYPAPGSSSGSGGGLSSVHQSPYALRRKLSPPEPSSPCSSSTGLTTTETHSLLPRKRQRRVFSSSQSAPDGEWNFFTLEEIYDLRLWKSYFWPSSNTVAPKYFWLGNIWCGNFCDPEVFVCGVDFHTLAQAMFILSCWKLNETTRVYT